MQLPHDKFQPTMVEDSCHARIANSSTDGRGLFSTKDIAAGDLIFSTGRPLIAVLDSPKLEEACSNCFSWSGDSFEDGESVDVKDCMQCRMLKYCSKKCQTEAWKRSHKFECKQLAHAMTTGVLPHVVRATMQLLLMRKKGAISDTQWIEVLKMRSHLDKVVAARGPSNRQEIETLAYGALMFSGTEKTFSKDLVAQIFAMLLTNSLTLVAASFDPLGMMFDPFLACANHSCDANAFVVMDGPRVSLRALESIAAEEEIFISYVDSTEPFQVRQHKLRSTYFFTCQCSKCKSSISAGNAAQDVFLKPVDATPPALRTECELLLLNQKDPSLREAASSPEHSLIPPLPSATDPAAARAMSIAQAVAYQHLEAGKKASSPAEAVAAWQDGLRWCAHTQMWPAYRQPYAMLRHEVTVALLGSVVAPAQEEALAHAVKTLLDILPWQYAQVHHPLRVLHLWMLAKMMIWLSDPSNADEGPVKLRREIDLGPVVLELLSQAASEAMKSHGEESRFARMVRAKYYQVRFDMTKGDDTLLKGSKGKIKVALGQLRKLVDKLEY